MNDFISRERAIAELVNMVTDHANDTFHGVLLRWTEVKEMLESLPPEQPTLYGYQLEHLAYIARVMQKENVTAEYAVRTFDDMGRAIKMIIDDARECVERQLASQWLGEKYE